jgi:dCMP deaminase
MDIAKRWAMLSHCKKKQVGAIVVKDRMIISDGFNGTPVNFSNVGEDNEGKTHWYVLHAEANAILKLAASTQNSIGATLYITCCPCKDCSKLIYQSGIKRVVYLEEYKTTEGVDFLKKAGIQVEKMDEIFNNYTEIIDSFELEYKSKMNLCVYKTINKAHLENDYSSINKSINILIEKYNDDMMLLRTFMLATNSFKDKLGNRGRVYSRIIQVCGSQPKSPNGDIEMAMLHNLK